jgi:hypothetical protein
MKKLLLLTLSFTFLLFAAAAPVKYTLLKTTNSWKTASNWLPAGYPKDGDTAVIPAGLVMTLPSDLTINNAYIDIFGSLVLSGSNLKALFTGTSTIKLRAGATLYGSKASQQIVFGSTIIYKGDNPVLLGPQIATATSNGFIKYIEPVVLPVKFTSFEVVRSSNSFLVQWSTEDEVNAAYYEVQRSLDGNNWKAIATVFAAGDLKNTYAYADKNNTARTVYYRIRQVDEDGTFTYTAIRKFTTTPVTTAEASVTAVQNTVRVTFAQPVKGNVVMEIVGLNGHIAATQTVAAPSGTVLFSASGLHGLYIVRVSNGRDLNTAKQVLF